MRLEYTNAVPRPQPTPRVLDYYGKILPFYEKEQEGLPEARLDFWRETARSERPRRILDVGAGLGGITSLLAGEAPTVGVDVSVAMLLRAAGRTPRPHLAAADMRRVCFRERFDLVTATSDPFCHLLTQRDRRAALAAVAGQLSDRGLFVLEGLVRRRRVFSPPPRQVRHARGVLTIAETWRPLGPGQLWRARYRYRDLAEGGEETGMDASFLARAWDPDALGPFFSSSGLSIEALWGDFDRRPFGSDSERLLVAARRTAGRAP